MERHALARWKALHWVRVWVQLLNCPYKAMNTGGQLKTRMIEAARPMPVLGDVTGTYALQAAATGGQTHAA